MILTRSLVLALLPLVNAAYHLHNEGVESEVEVPAFESASSTMMENVHFANRPEEQTRFRDFSNGGVVFFLHIPKTGGTTVRRNLEGLDHVQYVFAKNYSTYWDTAPLVEHAVLHGTVNSTVLFYEIHATDAPSFFRLRKKLRRWRVTAESNHVPFFFFTLLRDPVPYAFSHFSFFHVQYRNPTFEQCNATEENFSRLSLENPQCQFLFRGEPSMRAQIKARKVVKPEECDQVQEQMLQLFDWIGTTEDLSNTTLPLLARLLGLPPTFTFQRYKVTKESGAVFGVENVSASVLEMIHQKSTKDIVFYESAKRKYSLSTWDNL